MLLQVTESYTAPVPSTESAANPEEALISRSRDGDIHAFNDIVEAYQRPVYNLALRMLGDQALAEDATQDAFISAFRNVRQFRGGNLKSWLFKIVANRCKDMMRSTQRRKSVSLDAMTLNTEPNLPSGMESPEDYAMRQEMGKEIQAGLESAPQDQRLALVLVDVQGLAYEEAAEAMGTSVGTLKSRLSRGRARVRDYLRTRQEFLPARFRDKI